MIEVHVTQNDWWKGMRGHCRHCAVALTLQRQFPETRIHVTGAYISINGKEYKTDDNIKYLVLSFDMGIPYSDLKVTSGKLLC